MRCFLAIEIPESLHNYLFDIQKKIIFARCTFPKTFHITLRFFPDLSDNNVNKIIEELSFLSIKKFEASLTKIKTFKNRVVWLEALPSNRFKEVSEEIQKLTGIKDDRFTPHVTLARVKYLEDKKKFLENLNKIKIEPLTFMVKSLNLYQSTLTSEGPKYNLIKMFEFK